MHILSYSCDHASSGDMENKRSREDIVASILEITSSPVNKTAIMYRANMSFSQLRYYVQSLQKQQLIERKEREWVTTARGREYLQAYAELQRILGGKGTVGPSHLGEETPITA